MKNSNKNTNNPLSHLTRIWSFVAVIKVSLVISLTFFSPVVSIHRSAPLDYYFPMFIQQKKVLSAKFSLVY